jgi:hypothetical protein
MMPGLDPHPGASARKKRALVAAYIGGGATAAFAVLSGTSFSTWEWVPLAVGLAAIAGVAFWPRGARPGGGRDGGLSGRGREDDDGPAPTAAGRWHALSLVSRLMPRSAGRRWLAEAESLLSELAAARRSAAVRSYLLSAPRLVATMWARKLSRRARSGSRRPG